MSEILRGDREKSAPLGSAQASSYAQVMSVRLPTNPPHSASKTNMDPSQLDTGETLAVRNSEIQIPTMDSTASHVSAVVVNLASLQGQTLVWEAK